MLNAVTHTTKLDGFSGWEVREYEDGHYAAVEIFGVALSPGLPSFDEAVAWVRDSEARADAARVAR